MVKTAVYMELLNESEISEFLGFIWGKTSPLNDVGLICKGNKYYEGSSIYYGAKIKDQIVALLGLKFLDNKTVELGSLAVHPNFRRQGLTRKLFKWRASKISKLIKSGYQIITFATIGSDVMNFISKKLSEVSEIKPFPMNLGIGIIPINKDKVKEVLSNPKMIHKFNRNYYTSTVSILISNRGIYYEDLDFTKTLKLDSIYPRIRIHTPIESKDSVSFKLDPIRLSISTIRNINTKIEASDGYFNQIKIPLLSRYKELHKTLQANLLITGFSIDEKILHVVYSNITKQEFIKIYKYFKTLKDFNYYKKWIYILKKINRIV